ncbi:hypothetical protein BC827DRAFT_640931 [Russula dissimulans]|nr:hypothetical protein BC827DRAFT_640931 [Russula dissimulans]
MSQSYHLLDPSHGSSNNAPQPVPFAMTGPGANTQTAVEEPSAGRFTDEVQNMSTSTGADYPALFATVENDTRTQDTQNEWMPGFDGMVSYDDDVICSIQSQ